MKNTLLLALAVLSLSSAFAGPGDRDPRFPGDRPGDNRPGDNRPGDNNGPGGRMDFPQCLKALDNAERKNSNLQTQLDDVLRRCDRPGPGNGNIQRENEELRRDNARLSGTVSNLQSINDRLTFDNSRLVQDNNELRRQLDDLQNGGNRTLGFFSYAGCKDFSGNVDLRYIVGAEGRLNLESETNARLNVTKNFTCSYGVQVAATEEIRTTQSNNYCVAGCKDFSGNVDSKYIASGMGRNVTEATYNALKAVSAKFTCSYGLKVQACQ